MELRRRLGLEVGDVVEVTLREDENLPFFEKLERGERVALLPPVVLFQCWFVLTRY